MILVTTSCGVRWSSETRISPNISDETLLRTAVRTLDFFVIYFSYCAESFGTGGLVDRWVVALIVIEYVSRAR